jgi:L-ribulokinase
VKKYAIGIDFGTLSARALMIDAETGEEISVSVFEYPHKVMDDELPCGEKLGNGWALQHPQDYLDALQSTVRDLLESTKIDRSAVIGVGIDFTSCTVLPVDRNNTPLCMLPEFEHEPHAYVKLWKHHAAQYCADMIDRLLEERSEAFLSLYGGKTNSEYLLPKVLQIVKEAPEVYAKCDRIVEAADWIVWQLTGERVRSTCSAGYKSFWNYQTGYPPRDFLIALDPALENLTEEKLRGELKNVGERAGTVTAQMEDFTGLKEGTPVAVAIVDAHASLPACKISEAGKMLMILGTSTCEIVLDKEEKAVPGVCGVVKDAIIPGFFAYEAGQSCVGDNFEWFVKNCLPASYYSEAREKGMGIHKFLRSKAEQLRPGESGLLALDWWNGVRSTLMNFNLSGMVLGMTIHTKPEEIYRAMIESTAFGARKIIETYRAGGIEINELYAAGGIASKDAMMMQIYADVCNMTIHISGSSQSGALGSAIYGVAAAGKEKSGYDSLKQIVQTLGKLQERIYEPIPKNVETYQLLYLEYDRLYHYFGKDENRVMDTLSELKNTVGIRKK